MMTNRIPIRRALWLTCLAACTAREAPRPVEGAKKWLPLEPPPQALAATPAPDDGIRVAAGYLAPIPKGLTSFGAATLGGALYVLGGYGGTPHQYSREGQSKDVWRLRLEHGAVWERVGELPEGLQGLAVVAFGEEICRFGGNRVDNAAGESVKMVSVSSAACFHTKTGAWRPLPDLPSGRSSHEAAVIGGTVYVAGGWQLGAGGEKNASWKSDMVSLDLSAPGATWGSTPVSFQQRALAVATSKGKLIVAGGLSKNGAPTSLVHVFDPERVAWATGPTLPFDGFGVAAVSRGDRIAVSGRDGVVYTLDDPQGSWTRSGSWVFPRFFHRLAWIDDTRLVAAGGITGMQTHGRTRATEVLDLGAREVTVSRLEIAYPGSSKNRQGVFVQGDFLYLFGGNNSLGQHDFSPTNFVDEAYRLHLPSLTWSKVAPYPVRRQTMQVAHLGSKVVSVGGFGHNGEAAVSFNEAYHFDLSSETWHTIGGLPRGRTQFGLVEHVGQLFVFGGLNYDPTRPKDTFDHVVSVLRAPVSGDQPFREIKAKLPGPRRAFGGAALGDEYFIVGGMRDNFQLVEDCLRFSFKTEKFTTMACPAKNRLSAKLLAVDDKLYALAGSTRGTDGKMAPERSIDELDPRTGTWRTLVSDVGFDTHHAHAVVYRNQLLLVSTHNEQGRMTLAVIRPPAQR